MTTLCFGSTQWRPRAGLALRLAGWKMRSTLAQPLLLVLHLGYAWIPVALTLKSAALLGAGIAIICKDSETAPKRQTG